MRASGSASGPASGPAAGPAGASAGASAAATTRAPAPLRSLAIARFAVGANFRSWLTRGGILMGAAIMALGPTLSALKGQGWVYDHYIGSMGLLVMSLFGLRSGLAEYRELGLDMFVRHNLASRTEYLVGLLLGLLGTWLVLCATIFLLRLGISGDAYRATWTTLSWGARLLVLLGFVPLVEAVGSLRVPLIIPALIYMGLLVVLTLAMPEDQAMSLFIPVASGDRAALVRLATQGAVSFTLTSTLFLGLSSAAPALRSSLRSLTAGR
jgi:hypothetical protein